MSGDIRAKLVGLHLLHARSLKIEHIFLLFFVKKNLHTYWGIKDGKLIILEELEQITYLSLASAYQDIADEKIDTNIPEFNENSTYMHCQYFRSAFNKCFYMELTPGTHMFYGNLKPDEDEDDLVPPIA